MYYNKVEICGINTSHLPVLSSAKKAELLRRSKDGDEGARRELIDGNLRLVLSVIQRFSNRHENMDDLFQVGCIGLIKAIDNFNLELDVKFSTYAVPMIIGEVRRYLRDSGTIRVSRSVRDLAYRALQVREQLSFSMSTEPTVEQIAAALGRTQRDRTGSAADVALRTCLRRRRRQYLCYGSDTRHGLERRNMARGYRSQGGDEAPLGEGAQNSENEILQRKNADGDRRRDRNFASSGVAP